MLRTSVRHLTTTSKAAHGLPSTLTRALERGAPIDVHPEVEDALRHNKPVVALETTIVTHGMPHPTNLETAQSVERNVRSVGAIPATIGLVGGRVKIGLESAQLEYLADTTRAGSVKLSRRDLAPAIALEKNGGTTCSTTLIFAALAGIKVFATGGLGGVHRGGESSMDVSADLQELTRCPVGIVSAGVKSILDIGRTLEYLETLGVPVITYGPTDDFPAFYSRRSGFRSPWRVDDPHTAAKILYTQRQLGMNNGALFGVPIPEAYEVVGESIQEAVEQAVKEAEENGMNKRGKEVTPWLLGRVKELTQGKSLASNVALIENTSLVGGRIAVAYARLAGAEASADSTFAHPIQPLSSTSQVQQSFVPTEELPPAKLLVVGSAAVDITAKAVSSTLADIGRGLHSTSPGNVSVSLGGVGRNMAEAAHRAAVSRSSDSSSAVALISSVGDDSFGRLLLDETRRIGMRTDGIISSKTGRTAVCNLVLDGAGGLIGGVADMKIIHALDANEVVQKIEEHSPRLVAIDANLSEGLIKAAVRYCVEHDIPTFYEPTSVIKSPLILPAIAASLDASESTSSPVTYASPNLHELSELYLQARNDELLDLMGHKKWWSTIDDFAIGTEFRMALDQLARRSVDDKAVGKGTLAFLVEEGIAQMAINLLPFFQHLIIKCGERGVIVAMRVPGEKSPWASERSNPRGRYIVAHGRSETLVLKHFPAHVVSNLVNVTGAGDSLVGAILAQLAENPSLFQDPTAMDKAIGNAQRAAVQTLESEFAVSPTLSIRAN